MGFGVPPRGGWGNLLAGVQSPLVFGRLYIIGETCLNTTFGKPEPQEDVVMCKIVVQVCLDS